MHGTTIIQYPQTLEHCPQGHLLMTIYDISSTSVYFQFLFQIHQIIIPRTGSTHQRVPIMLPLELPVRCHLKLAKPINNFFSFPFLSIPPLSSIPLPISDYLNSIPLTINSGLYATAFHVFCLCHHF